MGNHRQKAKRKVEIPGGKAVILALAISMTGILLSSDTLTNSQTLEPQHAEMIIPAETPQQQRRVELVRQIVEEQEPITLAKVYEAARQIEPTFTEVTVVDYLQQYPIRATAELECKEGFEPRDAVVVDSEGQVVSAPLCYKAEVEIETVAPPIIFPPLVDIDDYSADARDRMWGRGWPADHPVTSVVAENSGSRVQVDERIARLVELLLNETERRGYLIDPNDVASYANRAIAGTSTASNHSWGLAVDLNYSRNPQTTRLVTDMPPWMPELWNTYGFAWGGHYGNGTLKDAMHYEFMGTPEDAARLTELAERNLVPQPPVIEVQPGILEPVEDILDGVGELLGG